VRAGYDLDALAYLGRELRGVTDDDADGRLRVEEVLEDLAADGPGGCGDNDHAVSQRPPAAQLKDRSDPH
jgi:serine/threonine protein kinase HipA of HipAB toxin-antitoxin module